MAPTIQRPSVQSLFLELFFGDTRISCATGFIMMSQRGPMLITARHNFTGKHHVTKEYLSKMGAIPDRVVIHHNKKGKLGSWIAKSEILLIDYAPQWVEHPILGDKADIVGLLLKELDDTELYPYDTLNDTQIRIAPSELVNIIGFPFGLQAGGFLAVWSTGFIASEPIVDFGNSPTFLVDSRTRKGQSGSPVLAYRAGGGFKYESGTLGVMSQAVHRFCGLYSGRVSEESDLGIVWKVNCIKELVDSINPD